MAFFNQEPGKRFHAGIVSGGSYQHVLRDVDLNLKKSSLLSLTTMQSLLNGRLRRSKGTGFVVLGKVASRERLTRSSQAVSFSGV